MFKKKAKKNLPSHIEYFQYYRNFRTKQMPDEDKIQIRKFYESHSIRYEGLTGYQQNIIFKRTLNYIYIVAHYYDKKPYAKMRVPEGMGDRAGFGVVRTRSFIFYKTGELLYELDHDYQEYPDNQIMNKKVTKLNYSLHDNLNNSYLEEIGSNTQNFVRFDRACHDLLKKDDVHKSVDFIKST